MLISRGASFRALLRRLSSRVYWLTASANHSLRALPKRLSSTLRALAAGAKTSVQRRIALLELQMIRLRFLLQNRSRRRGAAIVSILSLALIAVSFLAVPKLQSLTAPYLEGEKFNVLRNLLATVGGALIGATAIGFSVVMIAVQLNFARMPHGLFRRLSSDFRLLASFAATFLLAIGVSILSLVPDASWCGIVLICALWQTVLILVLFLYGYRRSLDLINPTVQLHLVVATAERDLQRWSRTAKRMAPLLKTPAKDNTDAVGGSRSSHDLPLLTFFSLNSFWTNAAVQAVGHSISYARRYAEQGDYEVSDQALKAIILINASYVVAKGKTFFNSNPIFDIPEASDGFIGQTLEHLRRLAEVSTARGDEEAMRQVFRAFAALVDTYMAIDYATSHGGSKEHAQLAAGYLADAVEKALPRKIPDVIMEGVRHLGASAKRFLVVEEPNSIVPLVEKIAALSCLGALNTEFRPVTLTGIEQLADLTIYLLRVQKCDIGFSVGNLSTAVTQIAQIFLSVPDSPLNRVHSNYLAPYFALTKSGTLADNVTTLFNALIKAKSDDKVAKGVIRNVEKWSEDLHRSKKTLLLLALEKQSALAFDLLRWIAHVSKILAALATAPAVDEYRRGKLEQHASALISVISWIPDDKNTASLVESYSLTDLLFETAMDALIQGKDGFAKRSAEVFLDWAFKAGRHQTGWATLERSMLGLITVALWRDNPSLVNWLRVSIQERLGNELAPDQTLRDRAARGMRKEGASLRLREFQTDRMLDALSQIDPARVQGFLSEVANILSPKTANEPVRAHF
jgi:hypothetical protein